MSNAASRSIKPDEGDHLPMSATEPGSPLALPITLERGAVLSIHVKVLRLDGPWVNLSVAGNLLRVLRSALEKELA